MRGQGDSPDIASKGSGSSQAAISGEGEYQPTSCLCRAQEGAFHSAWCDLRPFPADLDMERPTVDMLNRRYAESYGVLVEGEVDVCRRGDYKVFKCTCGCGGRLAVTGMLYAMTPGAKWFIREHAPPGVVHRGRRYREQAEA